MTAKACVAAIVFAASLCAAPAASAEVGFSVTPAVPGTATVGDDVVGVSLVITNASIGADATAPVSLDSISLVASCGSTVPDSAAGDCPLDAADPAVLVPSQFMGGYGMDATACAGTTFAFSTIDQATGQISMTPSAPVTLAAPGSAAASCTIRLYLDVGPMPTHPATASTPGQTRTAELVVVSGTSAATSATGSTTAVGLTVINKGVPSVSLIAHDAQLFDSISVDAYPSDPWTLTGSMTYRAFGPDDPSCAGPPVATTVVDLAAQWPPSPATLPVTKTGTYRWTATYPGDANSSSFASPCDGLNANSEVIKRIPSFGSTASGPSPIGGAMTDVFDLANAHDPSGTITFRLYGPTDPDCSGPPILSTTRAVTANGTYTSDSYTPTIAGAYEWVADYSGDAVNSSAAYACGNTGVNVAARQAVNLAGRVTADVTPGATVDSVLISGPKEAGGTITFFAFGDNDPGCIHTPVFGSSVRATGNGTYLSQPYAPGVHGVVFWIVYYSGDGNTLPAAGACQAPGQSALVSPPRTRPPPTVLPAPVGSFEMAVKKVSTDGRVTLTIDTPAAGRLTTSATYIDTIRRVVGHGRRRHAVSQRVTRVFASTTRTTRFAEVTAVLSATRTARAALRRHALRLRIVARFTATGSPRTEAVSASAAVPRIATR